MLDLGFLILLTCWAVVVGLSLSRAFDAGVERLSDSLALAIPLGLGALSLGSFALAESGRLDRTSLALFLVLGAAVGSGRLIFSGVRSGLFSRRGKSAADRPRRVWNRPSGRLRLDAGPFFDLFLGLTLLGTLPAALAPVTDGDALCYHLQVPKIFLLQRSATFDPDLHETVYPLSTEMLYAAALAFRGPVACRLIQWLLGIVFALNATALARPFLAEKSRWAGTIALLVPAISNGMAAPLNDVSLAAFGNAALFALTLWFDRPSLRRSALVGLFCGLALGVKYPALVWTALLASAFAVRLFFSGESRSKPLHWLVFALSTLAVGGFWYARAAYFTGNPVHPFFRSFFGGAGLDEVLDPIKRPLKPTLWNLATALAPLTLQPDRFDSLSHQFGPGFLLFLPALSIARPPKRLIAIVAPGLAFIALCLTVRQSMRFLLIAVGPLSVGVAWVAFSLSERKSIPAKILFGLILGMLAFESAIAVGRARHGIGVVLGVESAESYLSRREPTYRVGRWIDARLPQSARLIGQDHRGFYIPRPYAMELAHRRRTGLGTTETSPREIVARLREEGFTHILFCPPEPIDAVEFDPTLSRRLEPWTRERSPLFDELLFDADRVARRYRIFRLADDGPDPRRRRASR